MLLPLSHVFVLDDRCYCLIRCRCFVTLIWYFNFDIHKQCFVKHHPSNIHIAVIICGGFLWNLLNASSLQWVEVLSFGNCFLKYQSHYISIFFCFFFAWISFKCKKYRLKCLKHDETERILFVLTLIHCGASPNLQPWRCTWNTIALQKRFSKPLRTLCVGFALCRASLRLKWPWWITPKIMHLISEPSLNRFLFEWVVCLKCKK